MITGSLDSTTLSVLEQAVQFAQARHGVLAGNIANLNTPGYKTRDLSPEAFEESLKAAIESTERAHSSGDAVILGPLAEGGGLMKASQQVSFGRFDPEALQGVKDSMRAIVHHDGRDVSLESQVTELAKNQGMHNLALTLLSAQFRLMQAAISETVV